MTPNKARPSRLLSIVWWLALATSILLVSGVLLHALADIFPSAALGFAQELGLMAVGLMAEAIAPAAMLLIAFSALEDWGARRGRDVFASSRLLHVPIAVVLGLVPGCGGALAVTVAWSTGRVSFGTWVAALTATMGDAALPLAAAAPTSFATVWMLQALVALPTGWLVDAVGWNPTRPLEYGQLFCGCCVPETPGLWDIRLLQGLVVVGAVATAAQLGLPVPEPVVWGLASVATALVCARMVGAWKWPSHPDANRVQTAAGWIWGVGALGVVLSAVWPSVGEGFAWDGVSGWITTVLVGSIPGCAAFLALGAAHAGGTVPLHVLGAAAVMTDGDASAPVIVRAPKAWLQASLASLPGATAVYLLLS